MDQLQEIINLLVDPVSLEFLKVEHDSSGAISRFTSGENQFVLNEGILDLRPNEASIIEEFGAADYATWKDLQVSAEKSYAVRIEGHFSTENFQPATVYGEALARLDPGLFLDIGCGLLPKPVYMQIGSKHSYVGVDPMGVFGEREFPFVQAFGDFLPFKSEAFDGVMFSSSFDHTISPTRALKEALRVLKPGGYCVLFETMRDRDVHYQSWLDRARYSLARYNPHHNWAFSAEDIFAIARMFGLDLITFEPIADSKECVFVFQKPLPESVSQRLYGDDARSANMEALAKDWETIDFPEGARQYARKMHAYPYEFYRKRILQLNINGGRIYDAGGGTGTWSVGFAPDFDSVLSIDQSEERIEVAKYIQQQYKIDNIEFVCGDLMKSGEPDENIDVVFCYGVVISYLEFEEVFAEFHRLLKPGGRIYACVNGFGWWKQLIDNSGGNEKRKLIGLRGIYNSICRNAGDTNINGLKKLGETLADTKARDQLAADIGRTKTLLKDFFGSMRKVRVENDPNALAIYELLQNAETTTSTGGKGIVGFLKSHKRPSNENKQTGEGGNTDLVMTDDSVPRSIVACCDQWGGMENHLLEVFDAISHHCGEAFEWAFLRDLSLILSGKAEQFSHAKAGRSYEPMQISQIIKRLGFSDFAWGVEGELDLRPDDQPRFVKEEAVFIGRHKGDLGVWEFTATKNA